MHKHIVLDLETLGTDAGAAIIEIGAVAFGGPAPDLTFSTLVNTKDAQSMGFHVNQSTVDWWKSQAFVLPEIAEEKGRNIYEALLMFSTWYTTVSNEETMIWGNSPSFDCVILEAALAKAGLPTLWTHRQERDLRTYRWVFPYAAAHKPETPHRALDDALAEAEHLKDLLRISQRN